MKLALCKNVATGLVIAGMSSPSLAFTNKPFPSTKTTSPSTSNMSQVSSLHMSAEETSATEVANVVDSTTESSPTDQLYIPLSFEEMVKQVSSAMEDAYQLNGKTRQIIRILLPRSSNNDQLLQYYEDDAEQEMSDIILAPLDETWQGGAMQLYRAASYTCQELLRYVSGE